MNREQQPSAPIPGDVLVAKRSASTTYDISTVPGPLQIAEHSYASAVERATQIARRQAVDAWYTEDHTHFGRIASHRAGP